MLVPGQFVEIKWCSRNWKHYIARGYKFTNFGETFIVKAEDLMPKSSCVVLFCCDYCGKEHPKQMASHSNKANGMDCCSKCARIEQKKTCMELYGVESKTQLRETQQKMQDTCEARYGERVPSRIPFVKEKRKQSSLERFGTTCPFGNEEIKEKIKNTCLQRYGVEYAAQAQSVKDTIRESNLQKYGVPSPAMLEENKIKMMQTFCENGAVPTSKVEIRFCEKLAEIYGEEAVTRGFVYDWAAFDGLLTIGDVKIDCEWDGSYWHRFRQEQDAKRNKYLIHRGFKVLRVVANHRFPTDEQIVKAVDLLLNTDSCLEYILLDI